MTPAGRHVRSRENLFVDWLGKPAWIWLAVPTIVVVLLSLVPGVLHRNHREIAAGESPMQYSGSRQWTFRR